MASQARFGAFLLRAILPLLLAAQHPGTDPAATLAGLRVMRSTKGGAEILAEASNAAAVRQQLAPYGVRYTGIGHYSGDSEYDRSLLRRTWSEFPETVWGQRAFLTLQVLVCTDAAQFRCAGPNCFRRIISGASSSCAINRGPRSGKSNSITWRRLMRRGAPSARPFPMIRWRRDQT